MEKIRLIYLLEQYRKNIATPSEREALQHFLDEGANEAQFSEVVANLMSEYTSEYTDETADENPYGGLSRHVLRIDKGIAPASPKRKWYNISRYWAAASVIILLGIGIYYIYNAKQHPAVISNISPGIETPNPAVITLSNGTKVYLDQVKNGIVAQSGNIKLIKVASNQISYEVINKAGINEPQYHTVSNPRGGKAVSIRLSDGSCIWLNVGSSISYPVPFAKAERKVKLSGEGYFNVTKAPLRPFIVQTPSLDVKVLGTVFNVRAYGNEPNSEATLLKGSVEVSIKNKKRNKVILEPNEKIVVQNKVPTRSGKTDDDSNKVYELRNITINKRDSTVVETEWTQNRLAFKQEKIEDIIPVLERWFNVTIEIRRELPATRLFSGSFENDSLEDVLESLKIVVGFNYSIEKDKVVIF